MDPLTITAGAGLRARAEALDILANNLANASTSGFKADREAYTLYAGSDDGLTTSPFLENHRTDFSAGQLQQTDDSHHLALDGPGFFLAEGPNGQLLTRNGSFQILSDGRLTTPEGFELVSRGPRPIRVVPGERIDVDGEGTVTQNGQQLGKLKIVDVPSGLQPAKREGAYFLLDKRDLSGLSPSKARVQQGKLEASNVSPAEASIRLVSLLRQFETMQKALQIGGEMSRRAIEEVARIHA